MLYLALIAFKIIMNNDGYEDFLILHVVMTIPSIKIQNSESFIKFFPRVMKVFFVSNAQRFCGLTYTI